MYISNYILRKKCKYSEIPLVATILGQWCYYLKTHGPKSKLKQNEKDQLAQPTKKERKNRNTMLTRQSFSRLTSNSRSFFTPAATATATATAAGGQISVSSSSPASFHWNPHRKQLF